MSPSLSPARAVGDASPPTDIRAALFRLDLRLRLAVDSFRSELAERARDPFRGLYISDADVDEILASAPASELAQQLLDEQVGPVPARLRTCATNACTRISRMTFPGVGRRLTSSCACSGRPGATALPIRVPPSGPAVA